MHKILFLAHWDATISFSQTETRSNWRNLWTIPTATAKFHSGDGEHRDDDNSPPLTRIR